MVDLFLDKGADVNVKDFYGDTPLILAAKEGHLLVVKSLLGHKPNLEIKDGEGNTALVQAAVHGHSGQNLYILLSVALK